MRECVHVCVCVRLKSTSDSLPHHLSTSFFETGSLSSVVSEDLTILAFPVPESLGITHHAWVFVVVVVVVVAAAAAVLVDCETALKSLHFYSKYLTKSLPSHLPAFLRNSLM